MAGRVTSSLLEDVCSAQSHGARQSREQPASSLSPCGPCGGSQTASAPPITDPRHAQTPSSNALISFQKHEDESEAWLHRQVTIPCVNPILAISTSHVLLPQLLQHGLTLTPTGSSRNMRAHTHTHTCKVPWGRGPRAAQHPLVPRPTRPSRAGEPWALWEGLQEPCAESCSVLRSQGVPLGYRGRVHTRCLDLTYVQLLSRV